MNLEIINKKLEQIQVLLDELEKLLEKPFSASSSDMISIRAAERDFQLIVELASDINTSILIEKTGETPDSYRESFADLGKLGILSKETLAKLVTSARLRNILVHEYDFDEDYDKFYKSAKEFIALRFFCGRCYFNLFKYSTAESTAIHPCPAAITI